MKEKQEIDMILKILNSKGYFMWRNETRPVRQIYTNRQGLSKECFWMAGKLGSPDIIGLTANGQFIGIEVKTSKCCKSLGLTRDQIKFRDEILRRNGLFYLCDKGVKELLIQMRL